MCVCARCSVHILSKWKWFVFYLLTYGKEKWNNYYVYACIIFIFFFFGMHFCVLISFRCFTCHTLSHTSGVLTDFYSYTSISNNCLFLFYVILFVSFVPFPICNLKFNLMIQPLSSSMVSDSIHFHCILHVAFTLSLLKCYYEVNITSGNEVH